MAAASGVRLLIKQILIGYFQDFGNYLELNICHKSFSAFNALNSIFIKVKSFHL